MQSNRFEDDPRTGSDFRSSPKQKLIDHKFLNSVHLIACWNFPRKKQKLMSWGFHILTRNTENRREYIG